MEFIMSVDQILILVILLVTIVLFIVDKWRHDVVALLALTACVVVGVVPGDIAFSGFSHPAVITVACVLVMSYSLQRTGAIDVVANTLAPGATSPTLTIAALTGLAALMSAFMNNVGAMALLMPVAIQLANRLKIAPGQVLMPVAFGAILGGMTTLIGTPPNLIVAGFRAGYADQGFGMFSFTPVGFAVAFIGVVFLALAGWRLVPVRQRMDAASFDTGRYLIEVKVVAGGKAEGMTIWDLERAIDDSEGQLLGMVRDGEKVITPHWNKSLKAGDLLMLEAEPDKLSQLLSSLGLRLLENVRPDSKKEPPTLSKIHSVKLENARVPHSSLPVQPIYTPTKNPASTLSSRWFDRRITVSSERTLRGFQVGMRDPSTQAGIDKDKNSANRDI